MIRVLVVDDSAVVRRVLTEELSKYSDIEVVGAALDPYVARDKIVRLHPDVITLDLEMPRMDGLSFLAKLMKYQPMPVVVVSSLAPKNSEIALKALELGAVEVIAKPDSTSFTPQVHRHIVDAIRAAASARITPPPAVIQPPPPQPKDFDLRAAHKVLAIGASTGGTRAVEVVLKGLPVNAPGTVIVLHMPPSFTALYARRLDSVCKMEVREACNGDHLAPGVALVAPGGQHMLLERSGSCYMVRIKDGPPVHYQRPSVDVLFHSTARSAGGNAIGVLLTGMGADGAKGLLAMRESGAYTVAQNEETSVVFGMPGEAIRLGAAIEVLPLQHVAGAVLSSLLGKVQSAAK